ncbi:MAG: sulfurtransferase TusA family protein [Candidatus Hodarchaeales archaeon]|jgi:TusA-related sulfurtransferase
MTSEKSGIIVDITGLTCPIPLIKLRRAFKNANLDDKLKFVGTLKEDISRKEILIALDNMKQEVLDTKIENSGNWYIIARKIQNV